MLVQLLKNAFKPNLSGTVRSGIILKKDSIAEVTEDEGKVLISKGYAVKAEPKPEPKAEKAKATKEDSSAK